MVLLLPFALAASVFARELKLRVIAVFLVGALELLHFLSPNKKPVLVCVGGTDQGAAIPEH